MSDLDQLTHMATQADSGAAEIDAQARGPELDENGQPVAVQQPPDFQHEAAAAVDLFAAMAVGYAPKCATVWTDAAKGRTAAALAPVMEKYGFSFGGMPPELTLLIVAGPLLWQSSRIVAAQINDEKRSQAQPAPRMENSQPVTVTRQNVPNPGGPEVLRHAQVAL